MAYYETVLMVRQDVSEKQVESITDKQVDYIKEQGGKISRREYWGLRSLAYLIRNNRKAHYVLLNYESTHAVISEMERQLKINDDVLRFLTLRTEDLPTDPSIVMAKHNSRHDDEDFNDLHDGDDVAPHKE